MQQIIPVMQVVSRAKAIGLSQAVLAKRANVAVSTVCRIFERGACNSATLEKLSVALLTEEARVRASLDENLHESEHGHGEAE